MQQILSGFVDVWSFFCHH